MPALESKLYPLIRSLSSSEKRYFKIFAQRHIIGDDNLYVRLFDLIDAQEKYNEGNLFKSEKRFKKATFHSLKSYLYELIMRSLNDFSSSTSVEIKLRNQLSGIEILLKKTLYKQCNSYIKKVKETAYKYEKYVLLLEIFELEFSLLESNPQISFRDRKKIIDKYQNEKQTVLAKIALTDDCKLIYSRLKGIQPQDVNRPVIEKSIKEYRKKLQNTSEVNYAHVYFFYACGNYYFSTAEFQKASEAYRQVTIVFENNLHLLGETPTLYLRCFGNHLSMLAVLERFEEIIKLVAKIKYLFTKHDYLLSTDRLKGVLYGGIYNAELVALCRLADYNAALKLIPEIEQGVNNYADFILINMKMSIWNNIVTLLMTTDHYDEALKWNNYVLNLGKSEGNEDVFGKALMFNVIIHFEIGNTDNLEHRIKSATRFLLKTKGLTQQHKIFLEFLRKKAVNINNKAEFVFECLQLKNKLLPLDNHKYENSPTDGFNYLSWIDSKIEDRSMASIIRSKISGLKRE